METDCQVDREEFLAKVIKPREGRIHDAEQPNQFVVVIPGRSPDTTYSTMLAARAFCEGYFASSDQAEEHAYILNTWPEHPNAYRVTPHRSEFIANVSDLLWKLFSDPALTAYRDKKEERYKVEMRAEKDKNFTAQMFVCLCTAALIFFAIFSH